MKRLNDNNLIVKFDGVNVAEVYTGSFDNLQPANLKWRIDEEMKEMTGFGEVLTLREIADQIYAPSANMRGRVSAQMQKFLILIW